MRTSRLLWVVVPTTLLLVLVSVRFREEIVQYTRSARPMRLFTGQDPGPFDRTQSAALFVGVREFDDTNLTKVSYAVDDAVDLAHAVAMREKVNLVPPQRVVLALAGDPQKPESRSRLKELQSAGAQIVDATRDEINATLERQARSAGQNGMLIVSFATHGFIEEGVPYVLGKTSAFTAASAISTAAVLDTAAMSAARRSLILLDACRERVPVSRAAPDIMNSTAPLIEKMSEVAGQVVMYAAAAGKYAYDDDKAKNGVFTKAVLDGLECKTPSKPRLLTVDALAKYVNKRVGDWAKKRHGVDSGIQVNMDDDTRSMPLACCVLPPGPTNFEISGHSITIYDEKDKFLWRKELNGRIDRADVADLDGNGSHEVIVGLDDAGAQRIEAFSASGKKLWGLGDRTMPVLKYVVVSLFRKDTSQVIALRRNVAASESRISVYGAEGPLSPDHQHRGALDDLLVDRSTRFHDAIIVATAKNDRRASLVNTVRAADTVLMLDPKRNGPLSQLWSGAFPRNVRIGGVEIVDWNDDGKRDLAIHTSAGDVYIDFTGKIIASDGAVLAK
ncbi:MAG TPA: caspase family protein [Thermoanaerobaculia bacterium]|nr:caspase family protein [Thermoanaerobaculia bacterium]